MMRLRAQRAITVADLLADLPGRSDNIRRAIESLKRRGLVLHGLARVDGEDVETILIPGPPGRPRKS
jgi:hypothetical protein